jgi:cytochrome oxidase Cu insertion factor (SCO1/SenC/PrrC family)
MNRKTLTTLVACGATTLLIALCVLVAVVPSARAQSTPRRNQSQKKIVFYTCPMHPSVKSKRPGKCPECGMKLRLTSADESVADKPLEESAGKPPIKEGAATASTEGQSSRMSIPDLALLDQDGREIHFYSDLVKGKVVVIQFIFTTCTTICPPLGATFARVQKELGERAGRDVRLISVSVDPTVDTPERLKAWGEKFHAAEGWTFVTGPKPQIDGLLRALGAAAASREDHTPTILIGNDATGQWTRAYGLAKPSQLVQLINDAIEGRLESAPKETNQ